MHWYYGDIEYSLSEWNHSEGRFLNYSGFRESALCFWTDVKLAVFFYNDIVRILRSAILMPKR